MSLLHPTYAQVLRNERRGRRFKAIVKFLLQNSQRNAIGMVLVLLALFAGWFLITVSCAIMGDCVM